MMPKMPLRPFTEATLLPALLLVSFSAAAQEPGSTAASRLWGAVDVGYASLRRSYSVTDRTTQNKPSLALRAGYIVDPRLLLGVEAGGWTLESSQPWDPARGEGIETIFAVAQYYPVGSSPFYLKAGGGAVRYWNHRPSESGANGHGYQLGLGYDVALWTHLYFTPAADYSWGRYDGATSPPGVTQEQSYRAVTFRVGFTYR